MIIAFFAVFVLVFLTLVAFSNGSIILGILGLIGIAVVSTAMTRPPE